MTPALPIKFRCFQCNKLLGVSRSKAGAVVACPQCGAELVVPEPGEETPPPERPRTAPPTQPPPTPPPSTRSSPSSSRIEPVVVLWDTQPEPESTEPPAFPVIQTEPLSLRPDPPVAYRGAPRFKVETQEISKEENSPPAATEPRPRPEPIATRVEPQAVVMPAITLEVPAIREEVAPRLASVPGSLRETSSRRNDVVLPRAAVTLWSFVVLLGLVFAFATGLLVGRFLWAPGVALSMPTGTSGTSEKR